MNKIKEISKVALNFSYGEFLRKNPNATRKERQAAVKRFYDFVKSNNGKSKK